MYRVVRWGYRYTPCTEKWVEYVSHSLLAATDPETSTTAAIFHTVIQLWISASGQLSQMPNKSHKKTFILIAFESLNAGFISAHQGWMEYENIMIFVNEIMIINVCVQLVFVFFFYNHGCCLRTRLIPLNNLSFGTPLVLDFTWKSNSSREFICGLFWRETAYRRTPVRSSVIFRAAALFGKCFPAGLSALSEACEYLAVLISQCDCKW